MSISENSTDFNLGFMQSSDLLGFVRVRLKRADLAVFSAFLWFPR